MSNVVTPDFGRNPFIEKGDCIVFKGYSVHGLTRDALLDGMVLEVISRFVDGPISGQARMMEVGVPLFDSDPGEEGEWAIMEVPFEDVICRRSKTANDYGDRTGKVLQFESVSCNEPQGMI